MATMLPLSVFEIDIANLLMWAGILLLASWFLWIVYCCTLHPLAKVPGPIWPSLSRTWLMYRMFIGDYHLVQEALHKKYLSQGHASF